jgi:hypothetical protein
MENKEINPLAIVAIVCELVGVFYAGIFAVIGLILGLIAQNQIKETGNGGKGLADASVIIGIASLVIIFLMLIVA